MPILPECTPVSVAWGSCSRSMTSPDGLLVHETVTPAICCWYPFYKLGWRKTKWSKKACLRNQCNSKAWTQTYTCKDLKFDVSTAWPPLPHYFLMKFVIFVLFQTERDVSVRQRAVDLLYAMCDKNNAEEIVSEMLTYLETADYSIKEEMVICISLLVAPFRTDLYHTALFC